MNSIANWLDCAIYCMYRLFESADRMSREWIADDRRNTERRLAAEFRVKQLQDELQESKASSAFHRSHCTSDEAAYNMTPYTSVFKLVDGMLQKSSFDRLYYRVASFGQRFSFCRFFWLRVPTRLTSDPFVQCGSCFGIYRGILCMTLVAVIG